MQRWAAAFFVLILAATAQTQPIRSASGQCSDGMVPVRDARGIVCYRPGEQPPGDHQGDPDVRRGPGQNAPVPTRSSASAQSDGSLYSSKELRLLGHMIQAMIVVRKVVAPIQLGEHHRWGSIARTPPEALENWSREFERTGRIPWEAFSLYMDAFGFGAGCFTAEFAPDREPMKRAIHRVFGFGDDQQIMRRLQQYLDPASFRLLREKVIETFTRMGARDHTPSVDCNSSEGTRFGYLAAWVTPPGRSSGVEQMILGRGSRHLQYDEPEQFLRYLDAMIVHEWLHAAGWLPPGHNDPDNLDPLYLTAYCAAGYATPVDGRIIPAERLQISDTGTLICPTLQNDSRFHLTMGRWAVERGDYHAAIDHYDRFQWTDRHYNSQLEWTDTSNADIEEWVFLRAASLERLGRMGEAIAFLTTFPRSDVVDRDCISRPTRAVSRPACAYDRFRLPTEQE